MAIVSKNFVENPFLKKLGLDEVQKPREWVDDTGQKLTHVHKETPNCEKRGCCVHAPTNHSMLGFPRHFRFDRLLMERICPHGIGHPDPDHLSFVREQQGEAAAQAEAVHGCDGCCAPKKE